MTAPITGRQFHDVLVKLALGAFDRASSDTIPRGSHEAFRAAVERHLRERMAQGAATFSLEVESARIDGLHEAYRVAIDEAGDQPDEVGTARRVQRRIWDLAGHPASWGVTTYCPRCERCTSFRSPCACGGAA